MQVVEEDNATVAMSMERITNAFLTFRGNNLLVTSRFYMPDYFDALERKLVKKFTPLPENRPQIKQFELVAALFVAYTCDKLGAAFFPEEHQQEDHVPFLYDAYEQAIASFFHDENASAAVNEMFPVPLPINSVLGGMVHFVDTRFSLNNGSNAKNWWLDLRTRLETLIPEWTERNPGGNLQSLPLKYLKMLVVRRKRNNLVQLRRFFPAIVHVIADVHMVSPIIVKIVLLYPF